MRPPIHDERRTAPAVREWSSVRREQGLDGQLAVELVKAIRGHMAAHQIRMNDVADALGVSPSYATNVLSLRLTLEGGRTTMRALQRILDVLGLAARVELVDR